MHSPPANFAPCEFRAKALCKKDWPSSSLMFDSRHLQTELVCTHCHRWLVRRCTSCIYHCTLCSVLSGQHDYGLRRASDWQLARGPSWERRSTHLQQFCLMSCMSDVVCRPVLLAEQMLFFFLFFYFFCSGVTAHSSWVCWLMEAWWLIKTTSSTYIVGGTSWCKRTASLCWLSHPVLMRFLLFLICTCFNTYIHYIY